MSKLPDGWQVHQLKDISSRVSVGLAISTTKYYRSVGVPILRNQNIREGYLDDADILYLDPEFADLHKSKTVKTGDVITVRTGYAGVSCVVPEKYNGAHTFTTLITSPNSEIIEPFYLASYLNSEVGQTDVEKLSTSGGRNNLNATVLSEFMIPLPPLPEQRAIAAILSTWDEAITLTEALIEALQQRKQALMQLLLTGEVRFQEFERGEWEELLLGDLVTIYSGESPSNFDLSEVGEYPFIKVEDLNNSSKYQSRSRQYSNSARKPIPPQSVIFPKRGAAILNNKVRLLTIPALMDSNMMALLPDRNRANTEYLYYLMLQEKLYKIADTSTIPQINNKHIEPYAILLPQISEQEKIVAVLKYFDDEIELYKRCHMSFQTQKRALMQQLLTGTVRVQGVE